MRQLLLAAFALLAAACNKAPAGEAEWKPVPIEPFLGEAVLGNPAAPVQLIEYASTTCGHCAAFHADVLPKLKQSYIDTGQAKLLYRTLPTDPAVVSVAGIAIARCAGAAKFFDVLDELFTQQNAILDASRSPAGLQQALVEVGSHYGLTQDQVRTCVQDPSIDAYLRKVYAEMPPGVDSTPTLLVNGMIVEASFEALSAAIDAAAK